MPAITSFDAISMQAAMPSTGSARVVTARRKYRATTQNDIDLTTVPFKADIGRGATITLERRRPHQRASPLRRHAIRRLDLRTASSLSARMMAYAI